MSVLTVIRANERKTLSFSAPARLSDVLGDACHRPCGGRGLCKKCAVTVTGALSPPTEAESAAGVRLSCQAVLLGDATVYLPENKPLVQIEVGGTSLPAVSPMPGAFGAALDIGTTTLAMALFRLCDGVLLATAARENPQTAVGADVLSRMEAALHGEAESLRLSLLSAMEEMIAEAAIAAGISPHDVASLSVTGNTTMLYLLTGRDVEPLSHAPFRADCLFGFETTLLGRHAYLPPCMGAFVGADITSAVLACGMTEKTDTAFLSDIGTNGELALWKNGTLYVTSTAAGPAFEGAGITHGTGSIPGAIDKVALQNGTLFCHTLENAPAVGICGSGLIDAVAALLLRGDIARSGEMEEEFLPLAGEIGLFPRDIQAVQLAKAAIAAGIRTLLASTDTPEAAVKSFYLAGGFGTHLNRFSAATVGLFPRAFIKKVRVLGNAALQGASRLLLNRTLQKTAEAIAQKAHPIQLGGNAAFHKNYLEELLFPEVF